MRTALRVRTFGIWVLAWGAIGAVWMLLVDTPTLPEILLGAAAATVGTAASASVLSQHLTRLRLELETLLSLPGQVVRVPVDLWLLARELGKALTGTHRNGRFYAVPFNGGTDARNNGRRATTELFGSLAPNTIVLGVDEHQTIVHQLAARHAERDTLREMSE